MIRVVILVSQISAYLLMIKDKCEKKTRFQAIQFSERQLLQVPIWRSAIHTGMISAQIGRNGAYAGPWESGVRNSYKIPGDRLQTPATRSMLPATADHRSIDQQKDRRSIASDVSARQALKNIYIIAAKPIHHLPAVS